MDAVPVTRDEPTGDDYLLGTADVGVRYTFGSGASALRPFVNAAASVANARFDVRVTSVDIRGTGFTVGAGAGYFLRPRLSAEVALQGSGGRFTRVHYNDGFSEPLEEPERYRAVRLQLGLTFNP